MSKPITVAVGLSGGVDSSVAAYLLKQQGFNVFGLFMKNWDEGGDGPCPAEADYEDVVAVCKILDIPYYTINFTKEYRDRVFDQFITAFKDGYTPNPDVLCNREIKFDLFLKKALELGAHSLATGHYCRLSKDPIRGVQLLKGKDPNKDQSYFLHSTRQEALAKALFPIGDLPKDQVRKIAKEVGLPTHAKKDSTGICFIGERNFRAFLNQYIKSTPGNFIGLNGKKIGQHQGISFYTYGQRSGLGLGGPGEPWFVVDKNIKNNTVTVERGTKHPALFRDELTAKDLHWIGPSPLNGTKLKLKAKIRYRQTDQACTVSSFNTNQIKVVFDQAQRAMTPGQFVVFYDDDICLGGGIIDQIGPSYYEMNKPIL